MKRLSITVLLLFAYQTGSKFKVMKITAVSCLIVGLFSGCASFEPRTISPADTVTRYESRTLDNPDLLAFIQRNSQREVVTWPLPQWDFDLLTFRQGPSSWPGVFS